MENDPEAIARRIYQLVHELFPTVSEEQVLDTVSDEILNEMDLLRYHDVKLALINMGMAVNTLHQARTAEQQKFTIEEIKNYILSKDSLGDVMYFLNADNIKNANTKEEEEEQNG